MIKLVNEDCFAFLKTVENKSVDLVLTDPPYQISRETNFAQGKQTGRNVDRFRISMDFGEWDYEDTNLPDVISELYRVLKDHGTMICFYDIWKITYLRNYMEQAGFNQIRFIEWIKTNPVSINSKLNYLTNAREIALTGVKGNKPIFNSEYDNGVYEYPIFHSNSRFHPTQKSLKLFEALIRKHSNKHDLILDCFSGSGTTAVAAKRLNRKFIGCELDKDYYNLSLKRLSRIPKTLF